MIFLIEYNRNEGKKVTFKTFDSSERKAAEVARLKLELTLNSRGIDNEVVLLEANSETALRKTHRRYFENLGHLVPA